MNIQSGHEVEHCPEGSVVEWESVSDQGSGVGNHRKYYNEAFTGDLHNKAYTLLINNQFKTSRIKLLIVCSLTDCKNQTTISLYPPLCANLDSPSWYFCHTSGQQHLLMGTVSCSFAALLTSKDRRNSGPKSKLVIKRFISVVY